MIYIVTGLNERSIDRYKSANVSRKKKKPMEIIYSNHLHEDKNKIDRNHFFLHLLHRTPCGDLNEKEEKKKKKMK